MKGTAKENVYSFDERNGRLALEYVPCINYSMMLNRCASLIKCLLMNEEDGQWTDASVTVSGEMIETATARVDCVRPHSEVDITGSLTINADASSLMNVTEGVDTTFTVLVKADGVEVFAHTFPLYIMAFNQWTGCAIRPELLASFVTPNHPLLSRVAVGAACFMEKWTGSNALDEYQSQDTNRARLQVAAVFEALRRESLVYAAPPASFEAYGQRIRLVDQVLSEKLGTCIDLSLLVASCLESIGINPIIVITKGHCFVGAWLVRDSYNKPVGDDATFLLKNTADGINEMVMVEATRLTDSGNVTFDDAVAAAMKHLRNETEFELFIDVYRARVCGIRPLPMRVKGENGWVVNDGIDHGNSTTQVRQYDRYDLSAYEGGDSKITKLQLWERKLLDFTLRNNLLNMRLGKKVIPMVSFAIDKLEDYLQEGRNFQVLPFPLDERATPKASGMYDSSHYPQLEQFVQNELDVKKIHSFQNDTELKEALKYVYRASRTAMEENGANNLYLVLGLLQWYETDRSVQPRYAPILLLPIEIIRSGGLAGYVIRTRDEEIVLNITLTELLKQQHNIDLSVLNTLPTDDMGVDVKKILAIVRDRIKDKKGWNVLDESVIGLFSFNKFVMWNDIHSNSDRLRESKVIASLIDNRSKLTDDAADIDAKDIDRACQPAEFNIPVDVDSSQLEAIIASGQGKSFILHGPPGTGKSQTITNIIANALYQGKRVLFVAEKMAALSVVQSRLEKIGLAPFCLELHSNKVTKQHFLKQMETALNVAHTKSSEEFQRESEALFAKRQELIKYVEALHAQHESGLSLHDCITAYLTIAGDELDASDVNLTSLTKEQMLKVHEKLADLDTIFKVCGHPMASGLVGLDLTDGSMAAEEKFANCLKADPDNLCQQWAQIQKKWFLPRFFTKRSFMKAISPYNVTNATDAETILTVMTKIKKEARVRFRDWFMWCEQRRYLVGAGFECAVRHIEQGHKGAETADALLKALYKALANQMISSDDSLRFFNGVLFNETIAKYRMLTARFQELSKQELYCRLAAKIPSATIDFAESAEPGILKRNIKNGGRGTSIRKIIDQIPTLLPRLSPCMLMSPISVAQYIDLSNEKFDLVIFDEASQMPTSEAVGAIARGKTLVVVGDPRQMPPTSFFTNTQVDEDEADIDDMESILDDCISLSLPSKYLTWHYRSKHESLIAFSNSQYYDGRLLTFPSVDDQVTKVTLRHIDGVYDKGKTRSNRKEAEAIVNEVMSRLNEQHDSQNSKPKTQNPLSIGIVSFSKVQQNLIEDMLCEELAHHPELESLAFDGPEPIFVKNLENVQGDERDIILFSIGYGPDSTGKVSMNFGPLNNTGGERRLNVAVSRARYEMMVFTTLTSEQIDLRRSQALGVEGLKKFLEFAEKGKTPIVASQSQDNTPNVVAEDIANELRAQGYAVNLNVGRSQFKVDIAVQDPHDPSRYLLGILCDGKTYHTTKTARDREVVQPSVLRMLGWNIMRVWTLDWYERKQSVLDSILDALRTPQPEPEQPIKDEARTIATPAIAPSPTPLVSTPTTTTKAAEKRDIKDVPSAEIQATIKQIIDQQIAMSIDDLMRLTARQLGYSHRGTKIDQAIQTALNNIAQQGYVEINDTKVSRLL